MVAICIVHGSVKPVTIEQIVRKFSEETPTSTKKPKLTVVANFEEQLR